MDVYCTMIMGVELQPGEIENVTPKRYAEEYGEDLEALEKCWLEQDDYDLFMELSPMGALEKRSEAARRREVLGLYSLGDGTSVDLCGDTGERMVFGLQLMRWGWDERVEGGACLTFDQLHQAHFEAKEKLVVAGISALGRVRLYCPMLYSGT